MKGVYVDEMKMPEKCEECPMSHEYLVFGDICAYGCKVTMRTREKDCDTRPAWCPLSAMPVDKGVARHERIN